MTFTYEKKDGSLRLCFKLKCELYKVYDVMYSFAEVDCCLCSRIKYFLFGLSFEELEKLNRKQSCDLEDQFSDAFYDNYGTLKIDEIVTELKNVINK